MARVMAEEARAVAAAKSGSGAPIWLSPEKFEDPNFNAEACIAELRRYVSSQHIATVPYTCAHLTWQVQLCNTVTAVLQAAQAAHTLSQTISFCVVFPGYVSLLTPAHSHLHC